MTKHGPHLEVLSRVADKRLTKLRHDRQFAGVGAATKTGYLYCLNARADLIAVMEATVRWMAVTVPAGRTCAERSRYVKGNRFLYPESIGCMPCLRYIREPILSALARRTASFNQNLDAHCGYTVIQHQSFEASPSGRTLRSLRIPD